MARLSFFPAFCLSLMSQEDYLQLLKGYRFADNEGKVAQTVSDETKDKVLHLMGLALQGVSEVLNVTNNDSSADKASLQSVEKEIREIESTPLTVALLGDSGVGKSFASDCLLVHQVEGDAVQRLMEEERSKDGGQSCTLRPTQLCYGPTFSGPKEIELPTPTRYPLDNESQVHPQGSEEPLKIDVIEFPSPFLKNSNLNLIDLPGLVLTDEEHDKKATDSALSYFRQHTPDAIWIFPECRKRLPNHAHIILALKQLVEIGFFKTENPLFTPTVTYVLNPLFSAGQDDKVARNEIIQRFQNDVRAAICYVFNIRRDALTKTGPIPDLSPKLKRALDQCTDLAAFKQNTVGTGAAYYHIHRLEFVWFWPSWHEDDMKQRLGKPSDRNLSDGTMAGFESLLKNLRNRKTIRHMISCSRRLLRILGPCKVTSLSMKVGADRLRQEIGDQLKDTEFAKMIQLLWNPAGEINTQLRTFDCDEVMVQLEDIIWGQVGDSTQETMLSDFDRPPLKFSLDSPSEDFRFVVQDILHEMIVLRLEHIFHLTREAWLIGGVTFEGLISQCPESDTNRLDMLKSLHDTCLREQSDSQRLEDYPDELCKLKDRAKEYCESYFSARLDAQSSRLPQELTMCSMLGDFLQEWSSGTDPDSGPSAKTRFWSQLKDSAAAIGKQANAKISCLACGPGIALPTTETRISDIATYCEDWLEYMGNLEHDEPKNHAKDKLPADMKERDLKLRERSTKRAQTLIQGSGEVRFPNVHLSSEPADPHSKSHIVCNVDSRAQAMSYYVPDALFGQMFAPDRHVVLVPSKIRTKTIRVKQEGAKPNDPGETIQAEVPLQSGVYPNLFTADWLAKQPDSPSVIIVVDEDEAETYARFLRDQNLLWSPMENTRPVVLMRVRGPPEWIVNIGRKRQVMKLLMETLYMNKRTRNQHYVTHDDDIHLLDTVNQIGESVGIAIPDAVNFLHRIMDHESRWRMEPAPVELCADSEMPEGRNSPMSLIELVLAVLYFEFPKHLTLTGQLATNDTLLKVWQGTSSNFEWQTLSDTIEGILQQHCDKQLWTAWREFKGQRHSVAMVSLGNSDNHFSRQKRTSMFVEEYTHQNSIQMYSFVLYNIPSLEGLQYVNPAEFFALPSDCPELARGLDEVLPKIRGGIRNLLADDMLWAKKFGFKHEDTHFAHLVSDRKRLTFGTSLIMMSRRKVVSVVSGPGNSAKLATSPPPSGSSQNIALAGSTPPRGSTKRSRETKSSQQESPKKRSRC